LVPNAWDAVSARGLAQAGYPTIASSSGAAAWAGGRSDGQQVPFENMVQVAGVIAASVEIPVSIDAEAGYGDAARTVTALIDVGVAGINLEDGAFDGRPDPLVSGEEHASMIAAARAAADQSGVNIWINARTDIFIRGVGAPEEQVEDAIERLALYVQAGADCVFAPGLSEPVDIARIADAIDAPLNVMLMPGMPSQDELGDLGVARITVGVGLQLALAKRLEDLAIALREGKLDVLASEIPSQELLGAMLAGARVPVPG